MKIFADCLISGPTARKLLSPFSLTDVLFNFSFGRMQRVFNEAGSCIMQRTLNCWNPEDYPTSGFLPDNFVDSNFPSESVRAKKIMTTARKSGWNKNSILIVFVMKCRVNSWLTGGKLSGTLDPVFARFSCIISYETPFRINWFSSERFCI